MHTRISKEVYSEAFKQWPEFARSGDIRQLLLAAPSMREYFVKQYAEGVISGLRSRFLKEEDENPGAEDQKQRERLFLFDSVADAPSEAEAIAYYQKITDELGKVDLNPGETDAQSYLNQALPESALFHMFCESIRDQVEKLMSAVLERENAFAERYASLASTEPERFLAELGAFLREGDDGHALAFLDFIPEDDHALLQRALLAIIADGQGSIARDVISQFVEAGHNIDFKNRLTLADGSQFEGSPLALSMQLGKTDLVTQLQNAGATLESPDRSSPDLVSQVRAASPAASEYATATVSAWRQGTSTPALERSHSARF